jgi:hypothetical protein
MTSTIKQQILRLDISMRYTHRMQVLDAVQDLLESAFNFSDTHVALFDRSVEISSGTVFHHFTPMMLFVLDEIHCFDDICVVESGRDAEFGSEFLDVFLFRFVLSALSEFLQKRRKVNQLLRMVTEACLCDPP